MGSGREPLTRLDAALAEVHRVFRRVAKPSRLKNRMDFLRAREEAQFLHRDRSELSAQDLYDYVSECGGTLDPRELGWFLPRVCEVMARGETPSPPFGWVSALICLEHADFPNAWPDDQAAAIQRFVEALILGYVEDPGILIDAQDLGDLLIMAGKGGLDLAAITDALSRADHQRVARALARWIAGECFLRADPEANPADAWRELLAGNPFWRDPAQAEQVCDWLVTMQPWHLFAGAAQRETHPGLQPMLQRAARYCAAWPEAPSGPPRG